MSKDKESFKTTLKQTINGHSRLFSLSLSLRKDRLSRLTQEESFREYVDMYNFYLCFAENEDEKIDKIKLFHLLKRRNILNLVGKIE